MISRKQTSANIIAEIELIDEIKQGNELALVKLFNKYKPLLSYFKHYYYLRDFDEDDWNQEAIMICYKTALTWNKDKGHFAGYYKTSLKRRLITLIRSQRTDKRKAFCAATSLDSKDINEQSKIEKIIGSSTVQDPISQNFPALFDMLSELELKALLIELGKLQIEEVMENHKQLAAAKNRLKNKMTQVLN